MIIVISAGQRSQSQLTAVSSALFPASKHSQAALTAIEQEVKAYEDAVSLGVFFLLVSACVFCCFVFDALEGIAKIAELSDSNRKKAQDAELALQTYNASASALYSEMAAGKMEQKDKAATLSTQAADIKTNLDPFTKEFSRDLHEEIANIQATSRRNQIINGVIFIFVVALAALMVALVVGGVMRRINNTVERLRDIAEGEGDLTVRLDSTQHDELGELSQSFNRFVEKLQDIIGQLSQNAQQLGGSAHKLKDTSLQIANGSKDVASQSGTIVSASEEMAATSRNIAESCLQASDSARGATQTANEGSTIVQHTIDGMGRIAAHVQESARTVESLGTQTNQIGQIFCTIQNNADQINLHAHNTTNETTRAGEHGRGCAVVADEVRALAGRTTNATEGIREMIRSIQGEPKNAVRAKEGEQGTKEAERSGEALEAILSQINTVAGQVQQIATAAEQQTATTLEITNNIQQISQVVQRNAGGAQESAEATLQLDGLAKNLQELEEQFKINKHSVKNR